MKSRFEFFFPIDKTISFQIEANIISQIAEKLFLRLMEIIFHKI